MSRKRMSDKSLVSTIDEDEVQSMKMNFKQMMLRETIFLANLKLLLPVQWMSLSARLLP